MTRLSDYITKACKKGLTRAFICLCTYICGGGIFGELQAQTLYKSEQKSLVGIEVHFRHDKYNLDPTYMGNTHSLDDFAHKLDSIGLERIDSVVIVSHASPEGVYEHNIMLSKNRAKTMRTYIESKHPNLKEKLHVHPGGESWDALRDLVKRDTILKDAMRERVLAVIDADVNVGTKKWRMAQLPVYRYLLSTYYPRIRNSIFCILYFNEIPAPTPEVKPEPEMEQIVEVEPEPEPTPEPEPEPEPEPLPQIVKDTITLAAVKTNMLYDALTALNFEVEIPIGDKWSIVVEDVFPWWHHGNKWAFQMWEMGIEGRYWFKRTPARRVLSGHFGGVYAMSAKYDFQWKRDINTQGEYWSIGLTYGYSLPLGKHLNLELSASVGYLKTYYRRYIPSDDYSDLIKDPNGEGRLGYFGPTKLKAALVFPINITRTKREGVRYE